MERLHHRPQGGHGLLVGGEVGVETAQGLEDAPVLGEHRQPLLQPAHPHRQDHGRHYRQRGHPQSDLCRHASVFLRKVKEILSLEGSSSSLPSETTIS